jgi:hypothetical protein
MYEPADVARHILLDALTIARLGADHDDPAVRTLLWAGARSAALVLGADRDELDGRQPAAPRPDTVVLADKITSILNLDASIGDPTRVDLLKIRDELRGWTDEESF